MSSLFVAPDGEGTLSIVRSHSGAAYEVIPFGNDSALVAWTGQSMSRAMLDETPAAELHIRKDADETIRLFSKMLRTVLRGHGRLERVSSNIHVQQSEMIVATRDTIWRIDQTFHTHRCAYACIGDGARHAEAIYGEVRNLYPFSSSHSLVIHALGAAQKYDTRTKGPYTYTVIRLLPQEHSGHVQMRR